MEHSLLIKSVYLVKLYQLKSCYADYEYINIKLETCNLQLKLFSNSLLSI